MSSHDFRPPFMEFSFGYTVATFKAVDHGSYQERIKKGAPAVFQERLRACQVFP